MTMCSASRVLSPTATALGPTKRAWPRKTSPRLPATPAMRSGTSATIACSRSIKRAQFSLGAPTSMPWTPAISISCKACAAATRTFLGVQPRFGQVPPKSHSSTKAIVLPASAASEETPKPALPPPMITMS